MFKPIHKFKIFKSDAAPFFFYIEIFPPDYSIFETERLQNLLETIHSNPIMPLPMRVDRVFNGEQSILIRPREPISFLVADDLNAIINPTPFIQFGVEKLLYYTEIRAFERFYLSLTSEKAQKWWNASKFLYAKLFRLQEDFSSFLKAYIHTVLKAHLNHEDLINAAINYCEIIQEICEKRIKDNTILIQTRSKEINVALYKEKVAKYYKKMKKEEKIEYHPELVDIDIYDLNEIGFKNNIDTQNNLLDSLKPYGIKYIPILFYDDLLECMLQNLKRLNNGDNNIIDPSFLLDNKIILLKNSKELEKIQIQDYSWYQVFDNLNLENIVQSITTKKQEFFKEKGYLGKESSATPKS